MMNADGSYNIVRKGGIRGVNDFYKFLIEVSWTTFIVILFSAFLLINVLFAGIYYWIGIEQLQGFNQNALSAFEDAFFFSSQTFTTVGYGALAPTGFAASAVATLESFLGLSSFAIATGLLWGRFSKPSSKILFSRNILLTPFDNGTAVMFKMVNRRSNVLLNTSVNCTFSIDKGSGAASYEKEYSKMELEIDRVKFFPLTWTLVHRVTAESPFHGRTLEELKERHAEVVILVEAFDETYSQSIFQRHSYGGDQWLENVKFDRTFEANENGEIVLYIDRIDRVVPLNS